MINNIDAYIQQSPLSQPKINTGASKSDIRKVAEEFEGMFVTEMLRPMFETVHTEEDPMFGGGHAEEMYKSLLVDEYGKAISKAGGIGIADTIEAQLLKLQEV